MLELITDPAKITPQWLTQALRCSGHLAAGEVSSASYSMIGTGKMGDNARFELTYSDAGEDAPATVIAKLPAADETARAMAGARGAYYSEVMFYQQLAAKTAMRTPDIYANLLSEDRASFILLMEDLSPAEPGSQFVGESPQRTRLAMSEVAKLAAAFYGDAELARVDFIMTAARDDGGAFGQELLQQNWPIFLERFGHGINEECQRFGDYYVNHHSDFVMSYSGPKTLAHGDFRSENILFTDNEAWTVDWQTITASTPLTDLAYFMGGSVDIEDRRKIERDLVAEYAELLASEGVVIDASTCWKLYCAQAMHGLMITILGACFSEADERSDAMFLTMIQRHLQHCVDLDAKAYIA